MDPRVAVIMPCFNDGEYVAEAVASVTSPRGDGASSAPGRRAGDVELIVVDDGSTDDATRGALAGLERAGHRVVYHETNRGPSEARNTGLGQTSAPYVFPLDSDDIAEPGILATLSSKLDAHPDAAVCYGDFVELQPETRFLRAVPDHIDPFRIGYTNEMPGTALFRRSVLEQAAGWTDPHPTLYGYEDWNLWMSLAEQGLDGVHVGYGIPVFRYRLHSGRVNAAAKRRHRQLYSSLQESHPRLFAELGEHRARSDLGAVRKLLYPVVYGGRPRFRSERRLKRMLDRAGVWTLRR